LVARVTNESVRDASSSTAAKGSDPRVGFAAG
jgi:hypothetical protein